MITHSIIKPCKCQESCPNWDNCDEDEDNCIYKSSYWIEMSYYKYTDGLLTFNYSEYSDGEE